MSIRADFYVGRGANAEWLGSIAWDGYPERLLKTELQNHTGVPLAITQARTEAEYRQQVTALLAPRTDKTLPTQGWPWPWDDSATTDYAYAFRHGRVMTSNFGGPWYNPAKRRSADRRRSPAVFPDMSKAKQREKFGAHSGLMLIGAKAPA